MTEQKKITMLPAMRNDNLQLLGLTPMQRDMLVIDDKVIEKLQSHDINQHSRIMPRYMLETNTLGMVHFSTYAVICKWEDDGEGNKELKVLSYRRSGGDSRLMAKFSVGFGGHLELADVKEKDSIIDWVGSLEQANKRELLEELNVDETTLPKLYINGLEIPSSLIYLPLDEISKVHVGFVKYYDVTGTEFDKNMSSDADEAVSSVEWLGFEAMNTLVDQFELWSQTVLRNLNVTLHGLDNLF